MYTDQLNLRLASAASCLRLPRLIENDARRSRARLEDGRYQRAVPAAHVEHPCELGEPIGADNRSGILPGHARLEIIEEHCSVGRIIEVGEERLAVYMVEGRLPGLDTV